MGADRKAVRITRIYSELFSGEVINFKIHSNKEDHWEDHLLIANGLAVGDQFVQQEMAE